MSTHAPPPHPNDSALLEAEGASHAFGAVTALDGAELRVANGECLALAGESGSGKTTLLRCFNALVRPTAGAVRVRGHAVLDAATLLAVPPGTTLARRPTVAEPTASGTRPWPGWRSATNAWSGRERCPRRSSPCSSMPDSASSSRRFDLAV